MSVPGIVQSTLNGEEIAARVSLGGEDELFITPSSTLVYSSEGLLSDESVDEYSHEADRLTLSEGRRKTKFVLEYALEGTREFTIPSSKTDEVLHPVLAGVLNGNGITDSGETVAKTYRFSELTLIITSDRLVKHIGAAVWDDDYEEYHFEDVTNLAFEDGSVATQIVLAVDGRPQRIKAPNEEANDLSERLKRALFEYHDVGSLEELNRKVGVDDDADQESSGSSVDFGEGVDPLDADPPELDDRENVEQRTPESEGASPAGAQAADPLADERSAADPETGRQSPQTSPQQTAEGTAQSAATQDSGQPTATDEDDTTFEMTNESVAEADPALDRDDSPVSDIGTTQADDGDLLSGSTPLLETESEDTSSAAPDTDADSGVATEELVERIDSLEAAVDEQNELIRHQQQTIEQLIAELRKSR